MREALIKNDMAHKEDAFKAIIIVVEDNDPSEAKPGTHNGVH